MFGVIRYGACFESESFDARVLRVHQFAWEELDGDGPIEARIARSIDFAHSSGAERCQDLKRAEADSRREPHDGLDGSIAIQ